MYASILKRVGLNLLCICRHEYKIQVSYCTTEYTIMYEGENAVSCFHAQINQFHKSLED